MEYTISSVRSRIRMIQCVIELDFFALFKRLENALDAISAKNLVHHLVAKLDTTGTIPTSRSCKT